VPLYLLTRIELDGQWVNLRTPHSELAGVPLPPDCALVLFDLQGRQVAGWAASKGASCPEPSYPAGALPRLVEARNEVWQTQYRPANERTSPPGSEPARRAKSRRAGST